MKKAAFLVLAMVLIGLLSLGNVYAQQQQAPAQDQQTWICPRTGETMVAGQGRGPGMGCGMRNRGKDCPRRADCPYFADKAVKDAPKQ